MASLLPFRMTAAFSSPRTKRKMSSMEKADSLDELEMVKARRGPSTTTMVTAAGKSGGTVPVPRRWCESSHVRELVGFVTFEVLTVVIVALACLDWILFFKFVVEPEDHGTRAKWGSLWLLFTMGVLYFRGAVRARGDQAMRSLADHIEIFIAVSMAMIFSINVAFLMHTPSSIPLRDLGFMLIPPQAVDSKWRPLSDILTAAVPVLFVIQAHFMGRENRARVISSFFRVATVSYFLRMFTVSLTSLPGPAPHCRPGSTNYFPPQNWIDVVTRIGPMYGNYNSCGDLIFSGHMSYTTSAVLLYLRVLDRYHPRFSRVRWGVGIGYLFVLAGLCVSGRKHYTVDVVLGGMISALVFFHFEHSWTPLCLQSRHHDPLAAAMFHRQGYMATGSSPYPDKRFAIEIHDDDDTQAMDDYDFDYDDSDMRATERLSSLSSSSSTSSSCHNRESSSKLDPVDFIC